ncbi:hypothetical protein AeRB84_006310 [Aphanomyces euteiches]|nr:hypothetical protein AeRB84_006310 [Aphanomyces euteiches]
MGQDEIWVLNAPAIPQPPSFKGSTKTKRWNIMREYQKYANQIEALQSAGERPFPMPVSACMDYATKKRVAMFDLEKEHSQVTEQEWIAWFMEAYDTNPMEIDTLRSRLSAAIQFDMRIPDADSRVSRMLDLLMPALEADHQEWVIEQEGKMVVELIVKAIRPAPLKRAVEKQLLLTRNKPMKSNVVRFIKRVLTLPSILLDSGSDESVVTKGLIDTLDHLGSGVCVHEQSPLLLRPYGSTSKPLRVYRQAKFKAIALETSFGPLMLRGLSAWVDETSSDVDLLIGKPVMEKLGFSSDGLLVSALKQKSIWDVEDVVETTGGTARVQLLRESARSGDDGDGEDDGLCMTPSLEKRSGEVDEVRSVLEAKIGDAIANGLNQVQAKELRRVLFDHIDVFRLDFGRDLPVDVEPLKVRLKDGAVPVKCALRRYPPAHMEYLRNLEAAGLIYRNNRATWASAPRIPSHQRLDDTYALAHAQSGRRDGYDHLPLHPDCQMLFSFMTPFGVYTPTRILMGQTDAVAFCQSIISADGIAHDPDRVQGLRDLEYPATGADLQQFLCATNWMRTSIPDYARLVEPLRGLLEVAVRSAGGSSKKAALARVKLAAIGWSKDHAKCFDDVKDTLGRMVPLAHPTPEKIICLFTDASVSHWGAACTQIPKGDLELPLEEQRHEPLAFLSGSFTGSSCRWPTIEKEAFAVVEACKRLEYLLLREEDFRSFTDHRNLIYIFNPLALGYGVINISLHARTCVGDDNVWGDLLSRWGAAARPEVVARLRRLVTVVSPLQMHDFEWPTANTIVQVQRDAIGADREGVMSNESLEVAENTELTTVRADRVVPMADRVVDMADRIWVPDDARDLQQRLCIIAHQGAAGHRGVAATTEVLLSKFEWKVARSNVKAFIQGCLHCLCIDGEIVPRPWGSALHAQRPNELIHFDWLQLPIAENGWQYVLVVKDDMSGFCRLFPSRSATAEATADALMEWFTTHGTVLTWVYDDGSHFKNEVVHKIKKLLGAHHHITTPHTPWANGTIEVVNRLILRVPRSLISEMKLKVNEWYRVLPLVQGALNHQPSDRLGGIAPITAFQGLPANATPPLAGFVHPRTKIVHDIDWLDAARVKIMAELRVSLDRVHLDVIKISKNRREKARARREMKKNVKLAKFT